MRNSFAKRQTTYSQVTIYSPPSQQPPLSKPLSKPRHMSSPMWQIFSQGLGRDESLTTRRSAYLRSGLACIHSAANERYGDGMGATFASLSMASRRR